MLISLFFIAAFIASLFLDKLICHAVLHFKLYSLPLLHTLSFLGDCLTLSLIFFACFCYSLYKKQRAADKLFDLLAAFGIGIAITYLLKVCIGKARPIYLLEMIEAAKYSFFSLKNHFHSFPSSHTIACMTLFFYLRKIEGIAKLHGSGKWKILSPIPGAGFVSPPQNDGGLPKAAGEEVGVERGIKGQFSAPKSFSIPSINYPSLFFLLFAIAVALSRVFLLKHDLSDVIAGTFISYVIVYNVDRIKILQKMKEKIMGKLCSLPKNITS